MKQYYRVEKEIAGKKLSLETGKLAKEADGAVFAQWGNTVVLATAVYSKNNPNAYSDFFPLTVNYIEKAFASGQIPGGFFKREGRPSEKEVLSSRLIDRPLRPLFPEGFKNETQVIITVLSSDGAIDPAILGVIAASSALSISEIPFDGPIAAIRMGYKDDACIVMPSFEELKVSSLDLVVAGGKNGISMVESGSNEVSEEFMVSRISEAEEIIKKIIELEDDLISKVGRKKIAVAEAMIDEEIAAAVESKKEWLKSNLFQKEKLERIDAVRTFKESVLSELQDKEKENVEFWVNNFTDQLIKSLIRERMFQDGKRIDGRDFDEIRPITCETSVLPVTHGSAIFTRGETQAIVVTTLGSKNDMQLVEDLNEKRYERFMMHYNFPPYSVGEVKRLGTPGRREIGHGNLAKRAILPELPDEEKFGYTIRVVSEIAESNGSSSMATVCGATLSLVDAGVPMRNRVSGIAMGLVKQDDREIILTDIAGEEDHYGDMDFKVAGTANGINALQMDIKISGVTTALLRKALAKALEARLFILEKINDALSNKNGKLSPTAPRMKKIEIKQSKIRDVIGPSGKNIKEIIGKTGSAIDVNDDGIVQIYSKDEEKLNETVALIEDIIRDVEIGDEYEGKATRVEKYGAFIRITPKKEGMVHISKLSNEHIKNIDDFIKVGDTLSVKVVGIDYAGKIALAAKDYDLKKNSRDNREHTKRRPGGNSHD
ncbi:MAG: polyribonucleotide nucleotidyltransferase [Epsilonproteobacteria bacterium]|nr:polyribonucleotide nucleotidyltransferase [Campylobacterota bacterium]